MIIFRIFISFLKVAFLGFGGGYAMLSLIFDEASKFGMTLAEFADLNALDLLIPGPIAVNSATYVGQIYGGFLGGIVASLTVCIPSMVFVPIFLRNENRIKNNNYLSTVLSSIKAASVGLIFAVSINIMLSNVFNISDIFKLQSINIDWLSLVILIAAFVLNIKFNINPILLTFAAGVLGYLSYLLGIF